MSNPRSPAGARTKSRLRDDSGQAQIEFALTCLVLLPILFGITTFGIAMNNYLSLTEATGVGARQLAIMRGQGGDPCALASSAISTAAPTLGSSSLTYTITINSTAYGSTCSSAVLTQGQPITVNVTYPCTLKVFGKNYAPTCKLTAQTTEVLQ